MEEKNAVAAVCHPDPYPYYKSLLAEPALAFDSELQLWIASRATVIDEVLANPCCAVRPIAEPVPKALLGSSAGEIFGHLIRMNEGAGHERPKIAIHLALSSLNLTKVADKTAYFAALLASKMPNELPNENEMQNVATLNSWMSTLPVYVVGDLLGFAEEKLPQLALWMADFVRCLSPLSNEVQLAAASVAARNLLQSFRQLLKEETAQEASLLSRIQHEAKLVGWDNLDAILANLIGLLSQTYEATAGLIGNSIVAILQQASIQAEVRANTALIPHLVQEVCRFDPPVQNTRRFVTQATSVAGVMLDPGAGILLVLAAASRDPNANPAPDEFILHRTDRRVFGFGHGRHQCPGQNLACTIAASAIQSLLASPLNLNFKLISWTYRPSLNARIPLFNHVINYNN